MAGVGRPSHRSDADGKKPRNRDSPKIRPQIDNLPRSQPNQHTHSPKRKPLDALVRALIRISQLLLPRRQIIHLIHNLGNNLLHAAQVSLDRLEFLLGLNGRPVAGIGADFNIEFYRAEGIAANVCGKTETELLAKGKNKEVKGGSRTSAGEDVVKANIERGIVMRRKCLSRLANNVLRSAVFVAQRIFNLHIHQTKDSQSQIKPEESRRRRGTKSKCAEDITYVHIEHLAITLLPAHNGSNHHQLIGSDPVPYTPRIAPAMCVGVNIHFQCSAKREETTEEDEETVEQRAS
jgi:hypothetical protein